MNPSFDQSTNPNVPAYLRKSKRDVSLTCPLCKEVNLTKSSDVLSKIACQKCGNIIFHIEKTGWVVCDYCQKAAPVENTRHFPTWQSVCVSCVQKKGIGYFRGSGSKASDTLGIIAGVFAVGAGLFAIGSILAALSPAIIAAVGVAVFKDWEEFLGSDPANKAKTTGYASNRGPSGAGTKTYSPYEILGLKPGASKEEVQTAYRNLAKKFHPDKLGQAPPDIRNACEKRMAEINGAYDELKKR